MVHTSRVVSTYTLRNVKEEELVALILNNIKELSEYVKEIQKTSRHITSLNQVEAFRHEIAIIIKIRQTLAEKFTGEANHSPLSQVPEGIDDPKVLGFQQKICFAFDEIYHILHSYYLASTNRKDRKMTELVEIARTIKELKKAIDDHDTEKAESIEVTTEKNLYIKVIEAKDFEDEIDAYAVVSVNNDVKAKTPTKYKETHPCWDEEYTFSVSDTSAVQIGVWSEASSHDNLIGQVLIPIETLGSHILYEQWYNIYPPEYRWAALGSVHLKFSYRHNPVNLSVEVIEGTKLTPMNDSTTLFDVYCVVSVGDTKFTSGVMKHTKSAAWNETFEFPFIDESDQFSLVVWGIDDPSSPPQFIGECVVPVSKLLLDRAITCMYDGRFKLTSRQPTKDTKVLGTMRLKLQYTEYSVLPGWAYKSLIEMFTADNYNLAISFAESTKSEDKTVSAILEMLLAIGKAKEFVKILVLRELEATTDPGVLFRANTVATKAVDRYLKILGKSYLIKTIQPFIKMIYASKHSCELDPSRLSKSDDQKKNRETLVNYCSQVWSAIQHSLSDCPTVFREIFEMLQSTVVSKWRTSDRVKYTSVSGFIFLRFFCPAILSPKQNGVMDDYPKPIAARNLTLISKTIMNLSSLVEFGKKEPHMIEMNKFIVDNMYIMKAFVDQLCFASKVNESPMPSDISIAKLHNHIEKRFETFKSVKHPSTQALADELEKLNVIIRKAQREKRQEE